MHFIELCKSCGNVISQCRCPSKDKEVRYGLCEVCQRTRNIPVLKDPTMRQIPTSGEFCGKCYIEWRTKGYFCLVYEEQLRYNSYGCFRRRACLKDRPQVLTEEERKKLVLDAFKRVGLITNNLEVF